MKERRQYVRIPEQAEITYRVLADNRVLGFLTRDVSQGGIRFLAHDFIPKDSLIEIKLSLSKIYFSFETLAKVAWVYKQPYNERYEVGVEFVSIPPDIVGRLIQYIRNIAVGGESKEAE